MLGSALALFFAYNSFVMLCMRPFFYFFDSSLVAYFTALATAASRLCHSVFAEKLFEFPFAALVLYTTALNLLCFRLGLKKHGF